MSRNLSIQELWQLHEDALDLGYWGEAESYRKQAEAAMVRKAVERLRDGDWRKEAVRGRSAGLVQQ